MEFIFSPEFMPHGHCFLWQPGVLWLNVASDLLIFLTYFSMPLAILYLYRKRNDLVTRNVAYLFSILIAASGLTHLLSVWNVWHGAYWLAGTVKLVTATASTATAIALWVGMSKFVSSPTVSQLQREIDQKNAAVMALQKEQASLEKHVRERAASFAAKNDELIKEKKRLEAMQAITVDRELTMIALKKEINGLLKELNRSEKYIMDVSTGPE